MLLKILCASMRLNLKVFITAPRFCFKNVSYTLLTKYGFNFGRLEHFNHRFKPIRVFCSSQNLAYNKRKYKKNHVLDERTYFFQKFQIEHEILENPDFKFTASYYEQLRERVGPRDRSLVQLDLMLLRTFGRYRPESIKFLKTYMENEGRQPGMVFLSEFIHWYGQSSASDKLEVIQNVYEQLSQHKENFTDFVYTNLVKGFSGTSQWKKALEFMKPEIPYAVPSCRHYGCILEAAIREKDPQSFFSILSDGDLKSAGYEPNESLFNQYFLACRDENNVFSATDLMEIIKEREWIISEKSAEYMCDHFKRFDNVKWDVKDAKVNEFTQCSVCGHKFEKFEVSEDEFQSLRDAFLRDFVYSVTLHLRSNPREMDRFYNFLSKQDRFDVVIDGMNVLLSPRRERRIDFYAGFDMLYEMVLGFHKKNLRVLVICKPSLVKKNRRYFGQLSQVAELFISDFHSYDDIFLVYSALMSGKDTIFVTNDELRDVKAKLDGVKDIFLKWQQLHQVRFAARGQYLGPSSDKFTELRPTTQHKVCTIKDGNNWHIPYKPYISTEELQKYYKEKASFSNTDSYLCLRRK